MNNKIYEGTIFSCNMTIITTFHIKSLEMSFNALNERLCG